MSATVEIVQYEPKHIDEIMKNPRIWETKTSLNPDWNSWKQIWKTNGPAYTMLVDGKPIACGGVLILDTNIGEAWMVISSLFENYGKSVYSAIKRNLESVISKHKLIGIQTFVDPEFEKAKHMIKHLGFIEDGLMVVCGMLMIRFWRAC